MGKADPVHLPLSEFPVTVVNPAVLICHEKDTPELAALVAARDLTKLYAYLTRGFVFDPAAGDHDDGPTILKPGESAVPSAVR